MKAMLTMLLVVLSGCGSESKSPVGPASVGRWASECTAREPHEIVVAELQPTTFRLHEKAFADPECRRLSRERVVEGDVRNGALVPRRETLTPWDHPGAIEFRMQYRDAKPRPTFRLEQPTTLPLSGKTIPLTQAADGLRMREITLRKRP